MSYCPLCGNKVDETMTFCPICGASLKDTPTPNQAPTAPPVQNEKSEKPEKHEISEHGFVGYLMGGLILITIAVFALFDLTSPKNSGQDLAAMLLIIGVIIIVGGVYMAITSRKWFLHKR